MRKWPVRVFLARWRWWRWLGLKGGLRGGKRGPLPDRLWERGERGRSPRRPVLEGEIEHRELCLPARLTAICRAVLCCAVCAVLPYTLVSFTVRCFYPYIRMETIKTRNAPNPTPTHCFRNTSHVESSIGHTQPPPRYMRCVY